MSDAASSPFVTILLAGVGGAFVCGDTQPPALTEGPTLAKRAAGPSLQVAGDARQDRRRLFAGPYHVPRPQGALLRASQQR